MLTRISYGGMSSYLFWLLPLSFVCHQTMPNGKYLEILNWTHKDYLAGIVLDAKKNKITDL